MSHDQQGSRFDRLSADDLTNLAVEDADTPMHVGVVAVLDGQALLDGEGRLRLAEIRSLVEARLGQVPHLRKVVYRPGLLGGRPLWVDDPRFSISRHVGCVRLPPPGGQEQLLRLAEQLMTPLLDRSHPLWQLWLVTGLPAGRVAVIIKLHHAVADGLAAVRLVSRLLDVPGDDVGAEHVSWVPQPPPRRLDLVRDNLAVLAAALLRGAARRTPRAARSRQPWRRLRQAVHGLVRAWGAPRTSLNAPVGPRRRLAVVRLDLAAAKAVAHQYGAKVNDVVLDLVAGGLRALLASRGEPVAGLVLRVSVAVSLRTADEADEPGNRAGVIVVRLPLAQPDPVARLAAIRAESADAKRHQFAGTELRLLAWLARSGLMRYYTRRQHLTNLTESNVAGPSQPIRMLGAPALDVVPIGVLAGNLAISFLALSYAGELVVTVLADADRFPDLPVLVAAMNDDWGALASTRPAMAAAAPVT
ncbi:MAG TPA: wax ester/triacylglycerol synthase family O-acyltransferase [Micromonosporaceae bacterium]|nr:wax ester/triacylglycerol synthase family O-acyltransferase [Micromonosporaceae bacterium]